MLSLYVRIKNALASEEGQWNWGGGNGLLITVLVILAIVAVGAWIIFNVDINEK